MAKRPTPKAEIIVEIHEHGPSHITAVTPDARAWIEDNAPAYGELRLLPGSPNRYFFYPYANWDADEVADWFRAMGQEDDD